MMNTARETRRVNNRILVFVEVRWIGGQAMVRAIDLEAATGVYEFKSEDWMRMARADA